MQWSRSQTCLPKIHDSLTEQGFKIQFQSLNSEVWENLKYYLVAATVNFQVAPPGSHRRNASESSIRTLKNIFIAVICSTDTEPTLHLWDQLLTQALLTLNLFCASCVKPWFSAHNQLHGDFWLKSDAPLPYRNTRRREFETNITRYLNPHEVDGRYIGL